MLKILINGINGKMGKEVASLIKKQSNMHLLCGFDRHIMHNLPHPVYNDFNQIYEIPDVIKDFSVPEGTINILDFAAEKKNSYSNCYYWFFWRWTIKNFFMFF